MRDQICQRRRARLFAQWCVIAAAILGVACEQRSPRTGGQGSVSADAKIENVEISTVEAGLIVQYHTHTSSRDCEAQAAEMPHVWNQVVKARLNDSAVKSVVLFPEDPSGLSVAMEFTPNKSGRWSTSAPCKITIPDK